MQNQLFSQKKRGSLWWSSGYTMMELIIVMIILLILFSAAIAYYGNYRLRAERSQAIAMLGQATMWAEQGLSANGEFPDGAKLPDAFARVPYPVEKDFSGRQKPAKYTVTMTNGSDRMSYLIVAERVDKKDTQCPYYTMNHLGARSNALNGSESSYIATCWSQ